MEIRYAVHKSIGDSEPPRLECLALFIHRILYMFDLHQRCKAKHFPLYYDSRTGFLRLIYCISR